MKRLLHFFAILVFLVVAGGGAARAATVDAGAAAAKPPVLLTIDAKNVADLTKIAPGIRAISVGVRREVLDKNAAARDALLHWVRKGGTVFVHTDAAELFGYVTAKPRQTTQGAAGQFYGRAVAAVPLGAHPLLCGEAAGQADNAQADAPSRSEIVAVRTVYFALGDDDVLVTSHPAAVPLLQVVEPAGGQRPDYVGAVAPFGRGWAIFTPGLVVQGHGDGATFLDNIMAWAGASDDAGDNGDNDAAQPAADVPVSPLNVPKSFIDAAVASADGAGFNPPAVAADLLKAVAQLNAAGATAAEANAAGATDEPGLALLPAQIQATVDLLKSTDLKKANSLNRARAALYMLSARLARQSNDAEAFSNWAQKAVAAAPDSAEGQVLAGLADAEAAENIRLTSPARSADLAAAVTAWSRGLRAEPVVNAARLPATTAEPAVPEPAPAPANAAATQTAVDEKRSAQFLPVRFPADKSAPADDNGAAPPPAPPPAAPEPLPAPPGTATEPAAPGDVLGPAAGVADDSIIGVPRDLIESWVRAGAFKARMFAAEPPLVTVMGDADNPLVLRYFADDPSQRLLLPTAAQIANISALLGMRAQDEEFLLFPTPAYYAAYRQAAGLADTTALPPASQFGDAIGSRIIMLSQSSQPLIVPSPHKNGKPLVAQAQNFLPQIMGRLHAQVLLNQIAGDSAGDEHRMPVWIRWELSSYCRRLFEVALGQNGEVNAGPQTNQIDAFGPNDMETEINGNGDDRFTPMDDQAARLMQDMYSQLGPGKVVELLQRAGAGEDFESAVEDATGMSTEQLFKASYAAEQGG